MAAARSEEYRRRDDILEGLAHARQARIERRHTNDFDE
jgi:hypothetical protein